MNYQQYMKRIPRSKTRCIIHETPVFFNSDGFKTFIQNEIIKKQWIYRILSGEKEQEHILFRNDDYVILPDTDAQNEANILNWMIIFSDPALHSMRALRGAHVDLLVAAQEKVQALLPSEYGTPMLYFHYPPSVWQLHLHVAAPCDTLRTTNSMQKVCFLQDVVANLKIDPNYYTKATISFVLPSTHELSALYTEGK